MPCCKSRHTAAMRRDSISRQYAPTGGSTAPRRSAAMARRSAKVGCCWRRNAACSAATWRSCIAVRRSRLHGSTALAPTRRNPRDCRSLAVSICHPATLAFNTRMSISVCSPPTSALPSLLSPDRACIRLTSQPAATRLTGQRSKTRRAAS